MNLKELLKRYQSHYAALGGQHSQQKALELAVGGDFHPVGKLEYYTLKAHSLTPDSVLVDVGCGTGRLAYQLAQRGHRTYIGFDIVESAVDYARQLCARPDWTFAVSEGLRLNVPDGSADMVCFFSVFTHLAHEHTYLYLQEAHRLLKPGGRVVFTFLEFAIYSHWTMFDSAIRHFGQEAEPIVFLDRDAIKMFAHHLGYEVESLEDGDRPSIPLEEEIVWEDGRRMSGLGNLGQSIAVLRKAAP